MVLNANKSCMHKSESFQENESYKILYDFKIETDPSILARRPDQMFTNKKKIC